MPPAVHLQGDPTKNVFGKQIIKPEELLNESQKKVLIAIGDAIVPALHGEQAAYLISQLPTSATDRQRELVAAFAREGFMDRADYLLSCLIRQLSVTASSTALGQITLLLSIIATGPGCLVMTGSYGPFYDLPRDKREAILLSWSVSRLPAFRKAAAGLKSAILLVYYRFVQEAWEATGYPASTSLPSGIKATTHYPYKFENDNLPFLNTDEEVFVDTEVLIIGSGSGGGVAAAQLAKRGVQVLVVDKGIYLRPEDMTGMESHGYQSMYDGEGILLGEDGHITVLAGSTFGGGSTINWSASLKPRWFARRAWAEKYGVGYYASPAFTADLNFVCDRMGASTAHIQHNLSNSLLALGSQRCGMECVPVPQNTGGNVHYCGKCQFGCPSGQKQGGVVTWLKDAAEHGAKFMTQTHVQRILFDKSGRKAVGAKALVHGSGGSSRYVTIRAAKGVICAGGSIQTPALLLRTPELKFNKQIGKNLHLHPTTVVTGFYDFPINPWEGSLLTMVNNAAELSDPDGWGAKLEIIATSPGLHAAFTSFSSAIDHKAKMLQYSHAFQIIIISRDRDGGQVVIDERGDPRYTHPLTPHDQKSIINGILAACDVHLSAGAREISTMQSGMPAFVADTALPAAAAAKGKGASTELTETLLEETNRIPGTRYHPQSVPRDLRDARYVAWKKQVLQAGARPLAIALGSAHQMSSCRMGASPRYSACDPEGRIWGTKDLWIADASIMPEASGVNPMVTTMASANYVARNVAKQLGNDSVRPLNEATQREARL
ncbi:long-chain fatty alcohol dehydrogenase [Tilletiaria anomala UBC 951]|uniref:Long-chain-alcohol oxidase n=1 Tax=Tilletiaria anomala (strain ATCC 24038 / CBS 436.72 / UBC 951) TaxID=1037660 RepID=A0A066VWM0_TILAU|nr:long-chain fatty alcohol dehydrogenase [Tilletiaria anomala UBC 951]KDN46137.1 long-chain fatty alcohol dehydrogenase [Tilletiaria anomala UBC 951]